MPGRGKILKNLAGAPAGLCFVNCGLMRAFAGAGQAGAAGGRRKILVGGRRTLTIDIHAHCYVDVQDLIQGRPESLVPSDGPRSFDAPFLSPTNHVEARLRHMDDPREADSVLGVPGVSEADQRAILSGNAAKLLGIKV
jgi:hypothetical protein